jgi:tetratricopeptide (TPR) repeat protein
VLTERALTLDPTSPLANRDRAVILVMARRYDEAITQARRALELNPYDGGTYYLLGTSYEYLHREAEAIAAYIKPLTFVEDERRHVEALRAATERAGLRGYYEQTLAFLLSRDPPENPGLIALARLKLGDEAGALDSLDRLYAERWPWMPALKHDPEWDPLRTHPRFQRLMARVDEYSAVAHAARRLDGAAVPSVVSPETSQPRPQPARLPQ